MGLVYLDYNATTPLAPEVLAAMLPIWERNHGNPSSIHGPGREARAVIDNSRDSLASLLGARPHEIIFTGGGTEADNLAVIGLARQHVVDFPKQKRHLITAQTEHHAVLHAAEYLEKREGFHVTWLPVDGHGIVDLEMLERELREETALVSIMSANNETGTLQPVQEIARLCRQRGVLFHSDMIQSFGKEPVTTRDSADAPGPDAISITAHKFYGPKGAGALWLRAGHSIDRIAYGGSHENARRPGTENVAAIAGLTRAAEWVQRGMAEEQERQSRLRDRLWEGIVASYPKAVRNGHPVHQLANTLNVSFPGLEGESLIINFDIEGICVSSGSACMVGSIMPSHVLLAMGVSHENAQATVRFSVGKGTTEEEIENVVARMPKIVDRLSS